MKYLRFAVEHRAIWFFWHVTVSHWIFDYIFLPLLYAAEGNYLFCSCWSIRQLFFYKTNNNGSFL